MFNHWWVVLLKSITNSIRTVGEKEKGKLGDAVTLISPTKRKASDPEDSDISTTCTKKAKGL